jgi:hypothetical protein
LESSSITARYFQQIFVYLIPHAPILLILFNMNYDIIYYFSMTRSWEPEPKLHKSAPVKSFGSVRLHNIGLFSDINGSKTQLKINIHIFLKKIKKIDRGLVCSL